MVISAESIVGQIKENKEFEIQSKFFDFTHLRLCIFSAMKHQIFNI